VVATGIDQVANVVAGSAAVPPQTAVQRISVATERLRQEARVPLAEPAPVFAPPIQPHPAVEAELPLAAMPEVLAGSRFVEPLPEDVRPAAEMTEAFIPPQPERPVVRAPRMPRVEDLPLPGQNQLRAAKGLARPVQPAEAKRMTLLQRLAAVGLGRREDAHEDEAPASPVAQHPPVPRQIAPPAPAPSAASASGRRIPVPAPAPAPRVPHGLDQHGRPLQQRTFEDDQLEIPAFLRRQSN
jgi:cell division protein FtsZ